MNCGSPFGYNTGSVLPPLSDFFGCRFSTAFSLMFGWFRPHVPCLFVSSYLPRTLKALSCEQVFLTLLSACSRFSGNHTFECSSSSFRYLNWCVWVLTSCGIDVGLFFLCRHRNIMICSTELLIGLVPNTDPNVDDTAPQNQNTSSSAACADEGSSVQGLFEGSGKRELDGSFRALSWNILASWTALTTSCQCCSNMF